MHFYGILLVFLNNFWSITWVFWNSSSRRSYWRRLLTLDIFLVYNWLLLFEYDNRFFIYDYLFRWCIPFMHLFQRKIFIIQTYFFAFLILNRQIKNVCVAFYNFYFFFYWIILNNIWWDQLYSCVQVLVRFCFLFAFQSFFSHIRKYSRYI